MGLKIVSLQNLRYAYHNKQFDCFHVHWTNEVLRSVSLYCLCLTNIQVRNILSLYLDRYLYIVCVLSYKHKSTEHLVPLSRSVSLYCLCLIIQTYKNGTHLVLHPQELRIIMFPERFEKIRFCPRIEIKLAALLPFRNFFGGTVSWALLRSVTMSAGSKISGCVLDCPDTTLLIQQQHTRSITSISIIWPSSPTN